MQSCAEEGKYGREMVERSDNFQVFGHLACSGGVKLSGSVWLQKAEAGFTGEPILNEQHSVAKSMVSGVRQPGVTQHLFRLTSHVTLTLDKLLKLSGLQCPHLSIGVMLAFISQKLF